MNKTVIKYQNLFPASNKTPVNLKLLVSTMLTVLLQTAYLDIDFTDSPLYKWYPFVAAEFYN